MSIDDPIIMLYDLEMICFLIFTKENENTAYEEFVLRNNM